jgi:hypothetical protein
MLEFRVNDLISIKLENGQTNIYLDDVIFHQCKFLLLEIPVDKISSFDGISIDEAVEGLDKSMEHVPINIPAEVKFWAHCSNLQVWAENDYNTMLLHSNLSFPLLKKLCKLEDPIAKKRFKEEVAKRLASGYVPVVRYLLVEGYLKGFDQLELDIIFRQLESFLTTVEKKNLVFDETIFEILIALSKLKFSRAEKLLNKIIVNTFNSGDLEDFLILMNFESLRYLERGDVYWDFISSASIDFFDNLNLIAKLDLNRVFNETSASEVFEYFEDFENSNDFEDLENVIFQAQKALNSLNKMPTRYFVPFMRNLASFPIKDITNLLELNDNYYYHADSKGIINDNWSKFKYSFVRVKDKFIYVNRRKKDLVLRNLDVGSFSEIDNLETFSFLEVLDLSNNKISTISNLDKLSGLKKLRILNLSFNQIESVNLDVGSFSEIDNLEFSFLEVLDLSNNKISTISNLDRLSGLKSLNLSFNIIESVKGVGSLPNLEILWLTGNTISYLKEFNRFSNLKRLYLEGNSVTNLDGLDKLEKLEKIDLRKNKIQTVPKFTKELTNLKRILISNNPICKKQSSIPKKYKTLFYF